MVLPSKLLVHIQKYITIQFIYYIFQLFYIIIISLVGVLSHKYTLSNTYHALICCLQQVVACLCHRLSFFLPYSRNLPSRSVGRPNDQSRSTTSGCPIKKPSWTELGTHLKFHCVTPHTPKASGKWFFRKSLSALLQEICPTSKSPCVDVYCYCYYYYCCF